MIYPIHFSQHKSDLAPETLVVPVRSLKTSYLDNIPFDMKRNLSVQC